MPGIADPIVTQKTLDFSDTNVIGLSFHTSGIDVTAVGYGATGNGVTDDRNAIVLAAAAAIAKGTGIYFPAGTYAYALSLSLTVPVTFAPGAILAPGTLAITYLRGPIIAAPTQIFSANLASIVIYPTTPLIYAEWFGAVGDGVTDDSTAINTAITSANSSAVVFEGASARIQLLSKIYYHSLAINIARSNIMLAGMGPDLTFLQGPANTAVTGLSVGGPANTTGVTIENLSLCSGSLSVLTTPFASSGATATSGTAVYISNLVACRMTDVHVYNYGYGFYCVNNTNVNLLRCWSYSYNSSAANVYHFFFVGTSVNQSFRLLNCQGYQTGYTGAGRVYGVYSVGPNLNDQYIEDCEFNTNSYGVYMDFSLCTAFGASSDIRIRGNSLDQNSLAGVYMKNAIAGSAILIANNWITAESAGGAISLNACQGVTVEGNVLQSLNTNSGTAGIVLTTCTHCAVIDNALTNFVYAIYLTTSSSFNTIANNVIMLLAAAAVAATSGITVITTSVRNTIMGNVVDSARGAASYTFGIVLNANCDYSNMVGNIVNPAVATTTIYSDSSNTHGYTAGVIT